MLCNSNILYLFQVYFSQCCLDATNAVSCSSTFLSCLDYSENEPNFFFDPEVRLGLTLRQERWNYFSFNRKPKSTALMQPKCLTCPCRMPLRDLAFVSPRPPQGLLERSFFWIIFYAVSSLTVLYRARQYHKSMHFLSGCFFLNPFWI